MEKEVNSKTSAKIKLNFNFHLIDGDGSAIQERLNDGTKLPPKPVSKLLGELLLRDVLTDETKIVKFFDWARELNKSGELEVDRADAKVLKDFIIDNKNMFVVAKAQMLQKFEE